MAECKYCGKTIVWAENAETGKPIPLSPRAPVYRIVKAGSDGTPVAKLCKLENGRRTAMVLHHYDCKEFQEESR